MSRRTRVALVLLAGLASPSARAAHEVAISEAQMQQLGIALATATAAETATSERFPARVVIPPQQERVLSAPEAGLVTQVLAGVGEEVAAGARLARIESPDLIALQREYLQSLSDLRLAEADLRRDQQLLKEGIIAERRLLETRSRHEQASARVDEQRQLLGLAGVGREASDALAASRRLSGTLDILTPEDGVVLEAMAVPGQRVERAEPLLRVARLAPLWVEVRMPVDRARGVAVGTPVNLPCEGRAGRVALVGRSVDPANQTVQVRVEVEDPGGCVSPGQFVEVSLEVAAGGAQVRVPAAALVRSAEKTVVFLREPFGFAARLVQVVADHGGYAVVTGALEPGDAVAVSGLAALKAAWVAAGGTTD